MADVNELVEKYIKLRDAKAAIQNGVKEKLARIDAGLAIAESALMDIFNTQGIDSVGCSAGTAYKTTRTSATVNDWDAALGFIKENEAWHMLEKRVAKTAVEDYVAETQDLPPGIKWAEFVTINVRRS